MTLAPLGDTDVWAHVADQRPTARRLAQTVTGVDVTGWDGIPAFKVVLYHKTNQMKRRVAIKFTRRSTDLGQEGGTRDSHFHFFSAPSTSTDILPNDRIPD